MLQNNQLSDKLNYNGSVAMDTRLKLYAYNASGVKSYDGETMAQLVPFLQAEGVNWLQVHGLRNAATVEEVCRHFGIDFLTAQDILNTEHLAKVEEHDSYNVIILKQLVYVAEEQLYVPCQLVLVQGAHFLLTFMERDSELLGEVNEAIDKNALKIRQRSSDFLLTVVLNSVMTTYMNICSMLEDRLEELEERLMTADTEFPCVDEIQYRRRDYRTIKKAILPLKEHISKLQHTENNLIAKATRPFLSDVNDHLQFVFQTLDGCRELISALADLYLSNNDQRMNSIMKQLTIVSTIFIPLTFLAGIWGMNFRVMPELTWKYGYLFAWILMLGIGIAIYCYFRKRKWY